MVQDAQTGLWQTVGGGIEPDEAPQDAAIREAEEEAGIRVQIDRVRAVVGGPRYRLRYPEGDLVSYVSIVFDARVLAGTAHPDGDETVAASWFSGSELCELALSDFTVTLLSDPAVAILAGG